MGIRAAVRLAVVLAAIVARYGDMEQVDDVWVKHCDKDRSAILTVLVRMLRYDHEIGGRGNLRLGGYCRILRKFALPLVDSVGMTLVAPGPFHPGPPAGDEACRLA